MSGRGKNSGTYAGCSCGGYLYHSKFSESTLSCTGCGRLWSSADVAKGAAIRRLKAKNGVDSKPNKGQEGSRRTSSAPWHFSGGGDDSEHAAKVISEHAAKVISDNALLERIDSLKQEGRLPSEFKIDLLPEVQKPAAACTPKERLEKAWKSHNSLQKVFGQEVDARAKTEKRRARVRAELDEVEAKLAEHDKKSPAMRDEVNAAGEELKAALAIHEQAEEARFAAAAQPRAAGGSDETQGNGDDPLAKRQRMCAPQSTRESSIWESFRKHVEEQLLNGKVPDDSLILRAQQLYSGLKALSKEEEEAQNMRVDVDASAPDGGVSGAERHDIHTPTGGHPFSQEYADAAARAANLLGTLTEPPVPEVPVVPQLP